MTSTLSIEQVGQLLNQAVACDRTHEFEGRMPARFGAVELAILPESIVVGGIDYGTTVAVYHGLATDSRHPERGLFAMVCIGLGAQSCDLARQQAERGAQQAGAGELSCLIEVLGLHEVGEDSPTLYVIGTTHEARWAD